ncbi:PcfK-like family protein [Flavicella sediminum]|uniref:PcfK-like family protein n=1 Tax=Flavicella sediminum TaxID=2585141 RepID=UPI00111F0863|nr:Cas9 inhibitor AcrIIA9 family protein [Flavicella sediminum]
MKASNDFKKTIENHLASIGEKDTLFAETLKKKNKSIDECINYIFQTVKASGNNGFADEEIFQMAIHYYDEDDIKNIKPINARVVVNQSIEPTVNKPVKLTTKELEAAKQQAIDKVIEEEKLRLRTKKKPVKKVEKTETPTLF